MTHRVITTNLDLLQPLFQAGIELPARISWDSFKVHEEIRAAKVAEYRNFADGEHDVQLSQEMIDMLRTDALYLNHCENILETLSDRLRLSGISVTVKNEDGSANEVAGDEAKKWIEKLTQEWNRLDGLQIELHDAIPRDGLAFVLAAYDEDKNEVVWTVEEAFDGHSGVIVIWGEDSREPTLAIKIWHETQSNDRSQLIDNIRFNLYFADHIEKYIARGGSKLESYRDDDGEYSYPWVMKDGSPIGVAIVPFVYKGRDYNRHGLGRLENVIPIQRAVNRIFNSLVMTSELIGFPIRYALGMDVPKTIKPGTWLKATVPSMVTENNVTRTLRPEERAAIMDAIVKIRVGQIEPAQLGGLIQEINEVIIPHMYVISGTPYPEGTGANISGEALKQLDIRLVSTAQRCQTVWGNSWEDLVKLSARIEGVYGKGAPWDESAIVSARWESAEVRDDTIVIQNVKSTVDIVPKLDNRTRLEMMAGVHGWDPSRIEEIEQRINNEADAAVQREINLNGNGGFGAFGTGTDLGDPLNTPPPNPLPDTQGGGTTGSSVNGA